MEKQEQKPDVVWHGDREEVDSDEEASVMARDEWRGLTEEVGSEACLMRSSSLPWHAKLWWKGISKEVRNSEEIILKKLEQQKPLDEELVPPSDVADMHEARKPPSVNLIHPNRLCSDLICKKIDKIAALCSLKSPLFP